MIIINELYGILHPKIHIKVNNEQKITKVDIYVNDKLYTDYDKKSVIINDNMLEIMMTFPVNTTKVKVDMITVNEKITILDKKYSYSLRYFKVISKPFKLIYRTLQRIFNPIIKGIKIMWTRHHFIIPPKKLKRYIKSFIENYRHPQDNLFYTMEITNEYNKWINENTFPVVYENFKYRPLISIIIPVYNAKKSDLEECINSVLNQSYSNFEICISDDNSSLEETKEVLKKYEDNDKIKIIYRKTNGMISKCMNSAIETATGEFVGFLDNDDVLDKDALYYVVKELNDNKNIDFIYTDEDKIDEVGRYCEPHFKPDYSPDTLLSLNYICHLSIVRKTLGDKIDWFNSDFDGAQDYDLFLRIVENTTNIAHIAKVLYHWRKSKTSTASDSGHKDYALLAGKKALEAAISRRKLKANVLIDQKTSHYIIEYLFDKEPKVSIVIPTKDHRELLEKCLTSIYEKTTYKNFEVIVVDNNTTDVDALEYLEKIKTQYKNLRVIVDKQEFNFSKINNDAIKTLDTDYVLLLNNDTEIITPKWITIMVGYAMQKHIGCVGVKLLYPDNTVQHAGVILGLGGIASHAYVTEDRETIGYYARLQIPYNYSANTAACLMVSKEKYDEVGGLNEDLKVAFNDIDFNIKLLEKGYYNVFLPQVELYHYESRSRGFDKKGEKKERFLKETKYMNERWSKILYNDKYYNKNLSLKLWFKLDRRK